MKISIAFAVLSAAFVGMTHAGPVRNHAHGQTHVQAELNAGQNSVMRGGPASSGARTASLPREEVVVDDDEDDESSDYGLYDTSDESSIDDEDDDEKDERQDQVGDLRSQHIEKRTSMRKQPRVVLHRNGVVRTFRPDGVIADRYPDNREVLQTPDHTIWTNYPDGVSIIERASDGALAITRPNGTGTIRLKNGRAHHYSPENPLSNYRDPHARPDDKKKAADYGDQRGRNLEGNRSGRHD